MLDQAPDRHRGGRYGVVSYIIWGAEYLQQLAGQLEAGGLGDDPRVVVLVEFMNQVSRDLLSAAWNGNCLGTVGELHRATARAAQTSGDLNRQQSEGETWC
jgi:hypothetical protein